MIGNHAISLLTDAWAKKFAISILKKPSSFTIMKLLMLVFGGSSGREGNEYYFERGYIPCEVAGESAAKHLSMLTMTGVLITLQK